jgi:hypothetical protein
MIAAEAGRRLLAQVTALDGAEVQRFVAAQPVFQNIQYALALPPLMVDGSRLAEHRAAVEAYVALLEKVVALYRSSASVRQFFGLDGAAGELIDAEGQPERAIRVCRLDGYVEASTGRMQILENNADCPAGTLFTPRLNRMIRHLLGAALPAPCLAMDDGDPFTATLLRGFAPGHTIAAAVLQLHGRGNRESDEIAAVLRGDGHACAVVDPRELELTDDGLCARGQRLDLVWNKINTAAWVELLPEAPGLVELMARTCRHPARPRLVNSFGARYVAEAKTSLALLHADAHAARFTAEERALVARLVPWTARLDRDTEVEYEGGRWPLAALAGARQADLVLKQRYDIRGDGVTIGRSTAAVAWRDAIEAAWGTGAVLQRYITPARYPVRLLGSAEITEQNVSLDSFVFDGTLVGLGAKASVHDKVNLFQGGSKLAVVVEGSAP